MDKEEEEEDCKEDVVIARPMSRVDEKGEWELFREERDKVMEGTLMDDSLVPDEEDEEVLLEYSREGGRESIVVSVRRNSRGEDWRLPAEDGRPENE